ncbi:fatty acid synthase-like [Brevipalpus obovatus]|uniref:fatty acid synthase-like n=1 Tax=Brevipalpus obovatus TaxID=246614 RepID=UPI003D9E6F5E
MKTGIFIGSFMDDTERRLRSSKEYESYFPMFASKVSEYFHFTGPTVRVDTACASSVSAFQLAINSINSNQCDQAVVAGVCVHQVMDGCVSALAGEFLSKKGISNCLDAGADGYVRGEAVVALIIQKKSQAKRIRAEILASINNTDGYKPTGISAPGSKTQVALMREALSKANLQPSSIKYVEGHITGTQIGDIVECKSILEAYRNNSRDPLMLGCLKSLIGHSEGAAGTASISKVVKIFQEGYIPPNVSARNPNPRIEGLHTGQLIPIDQKTEFREDVIPVNAFGFGGANGNIILKACDRKLFDESMDKEISSRLVLLCNRSLEGLQKMVKFIETNKRAQQPDFLRLIDEICASSREKMRYRTFLIINNSKCGQLKRGQTCLAQKVSSFDLVIDSMCSCIDQLSEEPFKKLVSVSKISSCREIIGTNSKKSLRIMIDEIQNVLSLLGLQPKSTMTLECAGQILINYNDDHGDHLNGIPQNGHINTSNKRVVNGDSMDSKVLIKRKSFTLHFTENGVHFRPPFDQQNSEFSKNSMPITGESGVSFLEALGAMYCHGFNMNVSNLYTEFEFPVLRDCPSLGHLIDWHHDKSYNHHFFSELFLPSNHSVHEIDPMDPEYVKVSDHIIAGKVIFPATGYLYLIQKHLALFHYGCQEISRIAMRVWDMKIHSFILVGGPITIDMYHDPVTFKFVIKSENTVRVTGYAKIWENSAKFDYSQFIGFESEDSDLNEQDFYQIIKTSGYNYGPHYQNIVRIQEKRGSAVVAFDDDWMAFVDCFLQACVFWQQQSRLIVPTAIDEVFYDAKYFYQNFDSHQKSLRISSPHKNIVASHGIVIKGIHTREFPYPQESSNLIVGRQIFTPFFQTIDLENDYVKLSANYLSLLSTIWQGESSLPEIVEFIENNPDAKFLKSFRENHGELRLQSNPEKRQKALSTLINDSLADGILSPPLQLIASQIDLCLENLPSSKKLSIQIFGPFFEPLKQQIASCVSRHGRTTNFSIRDSQNSSNVSTDIAIICHPSINLFHGAYSEKFTFDSHLIQNLATNMIIAIGRTDSTDFEKLILTELDMKLPCELDHKSITKLIENQDYMKIGENKIPAANLVSTVYKKLSHQESTRNIIQILVGDDNFGWIENIKKVLADPTDQQVWLLADNCSSNGIIGLAKCLKLEPNGHRIRCAVGPMLKTGQANLSGDILRKDLFVNVFLDECWGFYRIEPLNSTQVIKPVQYSYLDTQKQGNYENLRWRENDIISNGLQDESFTSDELITVHYSALNYRDTLLAAGRLPPEAYGMTKWDGFGYEYSGITSKGERVCGLTRSRGIATHITSRNDILHIKIPESWSMEQAATVPICYSTVYYGLVVKGQLQPGETVLIHGGSGGVGLAAISVCLARKCRIFTTVSRNEKKLFVQKIFPQLDDSCFADSRSTKFEEHILKQTDGQGVDLVLNFLTDDLLEAGTRLLRENGRFIEIGKKDILDDHPLGKIDSLFRRILRNTRKII